MNNANTYDFEARWNEEVGAFLRFSEICDDAVKKWDSDGAKAYRALIDKHPKRAFHNFETTFLGIIGRDTELWDDDLFPPREMFLSGLMLVRWAVYKTCSEEEAAEYRDWSDALRYMAQWVLGEYNNESSSNSTL